VQSAVLCAGTSDGELLVLGGKMADILIRSRSVNTVKKYVHYFYKWKQFISPKGESALLASPVHLALYITHLLDNKCSDNIVNSTVYSIKWIHDINGFQDPTNNSFVRNLAEAAKRIAHTPTKKKDPVSERC
jgi:hypothetical protein